MTSDLQSQQHRPLTPDDDRERPLWGKGANGRNAVEADAGWRSTFLSRTAFPDRDLRYTNGRFGGAKSQWQLSGTDLGGTNECCVPSPASGEEWKRTFAANEKDKGEAIYYALEIFLTELR